MPTPAEFLQFLLSTASHWGSLMTGGITIAILAAYEHWKKKTISWRLYGGLMMAGLFMASFLAWRDEYRKHQELIIENAQWKARSEEKEKQISELQSRKAERVNRQPVREQLGRFLAEAQKLRDSVCQSPSILCDSKWRKWKAKTEVYLRSNLDSSYVDRFRAVEISGVIPWQNIGMHMDILAKFIEELKD